MASSKPLFHHVATQLLARALHPLAPLVSLDTEDEEDVSKVYEPLAIESRKTVRLTNPVRTFLETEGDKTSVAVKEVQSVDLDAAVLSASLQSWVPDRPVDELVMALMAAATGGLAAEGQAYQTGHPSRTLLLFLDADEGPALDTNTSSARNRNYDSFLVVVKKGGAYYPVWGALKQFGFGALAYTVFEDSWGVRREATRALKKVMRVSVVAARPRRPILPLESATGVLGFFYLLLALVGTSGTLGEANFAEVERDLGRTAFPFLVISRDEATEGLKYDPIAFIGARLVLLARGLPPVRAWGTPAPTFSKEVAIIDNAAQPPTLFIDHTGKKTESTAVKDPVEDKNFQDLADGKMSTIAPSIAVALAPATSTTFNPVRDAIGFPFQPKSFLGSPAEGPGVIGALNGVEGAWAEVAFSFISWLAPRETMGVQTRRAYVATGRRVGVELGLGGRDFMEMYASVVTGEVETAASFLSVQSASVSGVLALFVSLAKELNRRAFGRFQLSDSLDSLLSLQYNMLYNWLATTVFLGAGYYVDASRVQGLLEGRDDWTDAASLLTDKELPKAKGTPPPYADFIFDRLALTFASAYGKNPPGRGEVQGPVSSTAFTAVSLKLAAMLAVFFAQPESVRVQAFQEALKLPGASKTFEKSLGPHHLCLYPSAVEFQRGGAQSWINTGLAGAIAARMLAGLLNPKGDARYKGEDKEGVAAARKVTGDLMEQLTDWYAKPPTLKEQNRLVKGVLWEKGRNPATVIKPSVVSPAKKKGTTAVGPSIDVEQVAAVRAQVEALLDGLKKGGPIDAIAFKASKLIDAFGDPAYKRSVEQTRALGNALSTYLGEIDDARELEEEDLEDEDQNVDEQRAVMMASALDQFLRALRENETKAGENPEETNPQVKFLGSVVFPSSTVDADDVTKAKAWSTLQTTLTAQGQVALQTIDGLLEAAAPGDGKGKVAPPKAVPSQPLPTPQSKWS